MEDVDPGNVQPVRQCLNSRGRSEKKNGLKKSKTGPLYTALIYVRRQIYTSGAYQISHNDVSEKAIQESIMANDKAFPGPIGQQALSLDPHFTDQTLQQAIALHQHGQFDRAESLYRQILYVNPDCFDALHLLGVIATQKGNPQVAVELIGKALKIDPDEPTAQSNMGNALRDLHRPAEALQCYEHALRLKPDYVNALCNRGNALWDLKRYDEALTSLDLALRCKPDFVEAFNNRGNVLRDLGHFEEALASYDTALQLRPDYADALNNRGNALRDLGRLEEALESYIRSLQFRPGHAETIINLGHALHELQRSIDALACYDAVLQSNPDNPEVLNCRGTVLADLGRHEEALANYGSALKLKPDYAEAFNNRGNALLELNRPQEALVSYDGALKLKPDYAEAFNNRGNALLELNRPQEALASYDSALKLKPDYAEAHNNRGNALRDLGRYEDALASYGRAIRISPNFADAHLNAGLSRLRLGDFVQGWKEYEWRARGEESKDIKREYSQPLWLGKEPLLGKTILLHAEQGYGDTIQFCRYAGKVAALGATVLLDVPEPLHPLLRKVKGISRILEVREPLPAFDYHCPLPSLPLAFDTTIDTIPADIPYIDVEMDRVAFWRGRLGLATGPRIGMAWSGNPAHKNDRNRSIPFGVFASLICEQAQFISLQKSVRDSDKPMLEQRQDVVRLGDELNDFGDAAAVIANLDLVITVDTSVAHLAGAIGKQVWLLLPFCPDWRWLLDRVDSPWYPTVRLFRQQQDRNWSNVIALVSKEIIKSFDIPARCN